MATLEFERAKTAIAASDVDEARELVAALKARFASLGIMIEVIIEGSDDGIAPELRRDITWAEIEADLAKHHAGEKGFNRAHMRSSLRSSPSAEMNI